MKFNNIPKRGEKGISFDTWQNVVRQVKKLFNIRFDPSVFSVIEDPTGIYVTSRPSTGGLGDDPSLWKFGCTLQSTTTGTPPDTSTTYKVHVEEGWFIINGKTDPSGDPIYISAGDYDLPTGGSDGDYCYVTLNYVISTEEATIQVYSDFPVQTATDYNCPLVEYKYTIADPTEEEPNPQGVWSPESPSYICHRGNVMVNTPIVFG